MPWRPCWQHLRQIPERPRPRRVFSTAQDIRSPAPGASRRQLGAARGSLFTPLGDRTEQRHEEPASRLGPVQRPHGAPRGGGSDRLHGPRFLRLITTSVTSASGSPRPAGRTLFVPAARAIHHDQLSTDLSAGLPRIVEFHRNRDRFMRKRLPHQRSDRRRADRLDLRGTSPRRLRLTGAPRQHLLGPRPPGSPARQR